MKIILIAYCKDDKMGWLKIFGIKAGYRARRIGWRLRAWGRARNAKLEAQAKFRSEEFGKGKPPGMFESKEALFAGREAKRKAQKEESMRFDARIREEEARVKDLVAKERAEMARLKLQKKQRRLQRVEQERMARGEVLHEVVEAGRLLHGKGGSSAAVMEEEARLKKVRIKDEEAVLARRRTEQEDARIKAEQEQKFKLDAEEKAKKLRDEAEQLKRRKQEELDIQERKRRDRKRAKQAESAARRARERGEAQQYALLHGWR